MKVLLIVDPQVDFCPGGALAVAEGDVAVRVANQLLASSVFDLRVASRDWHPLNHSSFVDNNPGTKLFDQIELNGIPQVMWPRHCEAGTPGARFNPELDTSKLDCIIDKGTDPEVDSYSAFFDNCRRKETPLLAYLESEARAAGSSLQDITLTVCGLALDYCVAATLRDARDLGIKCELALDATRAVNVTPGDDLRTLRELTEMGVEVVESHQLLAGGEVRRNVEIQR